MMPDFQDDRSSTERSAPSSPGPELEPGELIERDESVEMDPDSEQLDQDVIDTEHLLEVLLDIEDAGENLLTA